MQLFDRLVEAWPERTIVPSLAERWEISDDGLRYVFHLREGLAWSDGTPLTAHDVEFGIKRVLDPESPGSSVAIYFVLENGAGLLPRPQHATGTRIGVRALDDRTVEFRLVAPAPYFMSVMNRPDGGPQPRHAIERTATPGPNPDAGRQRRVPRSPSGPTSGSCWSGAGTRTSPARQRRRGRALPDASIDDALAPLRARRAGHDPRPLHAAARRPHAAGGRATTRVLGPGRLVGVPPLRPHASRGRRTLELRRALAHAIDRDALAGGVPANLRRGHRRRRPAGAAGAHARHRASLRPGARARAASPLGLRRRARARRPRRVVGRLLERSRRGWRDVLGVAVESRRGRGRGGGGSRAAGARSRPIGITGWLPGLPRPRVLPAPALPVDEPRRTRAASPIRPSTS